MRFISSTCLTIAVMMLPGLVTHAADLRAGAGKSEIKTAPDMWPVDGFTSQHDPLVTRVLILNAATGSAAIVVIDQTSIMDGTIARVKEIVSSIASVAPQNTLVIASHTFSAPHIFGGSHGAPPAGAGAPGPGGPPAQASPATLAYTQSLLASVEAAVQQANSSLQPVKVGFAVGTSDVAINRDVQTPLGWWLGGSAIGFTDRSLPVLRIDKMNGRPLAVLINEAVQSSVMDHSVNTDGAKPITSDLAGASTRYIEQQYGGDTVAFFLIGAAGDQAPILQGNRYVQHQDGSTTRVDIHEAGFTLVELLGERLGADAMQVSESATSSPASVVQVFRRSAEVSSQAGSQGLPTGPVKTYSYQPGPTVQVPVVLLRIGDIVIVGLQAELAASIGAQIKAESPFPHTMVVTMVDGAAKYMPDAKSYPEFTYEARNSRFAQGAAEALAASINGMLKDILASPSGK